MFEQFLEEIGLSEKESRVYLALLQVDAGSIHDIAEKTKINRTTVYPVLESLGKKGLVSETSEGKKTFYQAAPPERLETYMKRQKVVLQEQSARLKDILPQIKSIQREQGERPIVKSFQGRDGAISAYTEFYSFSNSIEKNGYFILNSDLLSKIFTETEMNHFRELRKNKKINSVVIYNRKDGERTFEKTKIALHIDNKSFPITCDIAIIDDNIVISTLGNTINSFLIKSKDIADTLKTLIHYCSSK